MPYKACIFDLDGTLADTLQSIACFGNGTLNAFGYPSIDPEEYKLLVGNGADMLIRRMLARVGAGLSEAEIKNFRAEYDRRYESRPMHLVTAYPGLQGLLSKLKSNGVKLGVLSNKPDNMTRAIVSKLYGNTPGAVRGQLPGIPAKPDPTAALDMARELGVSPGDVLYIGDSGVDMDTAKNADMDSCGVLWGFRTEGELLEHGAKYRAGDAAALENIIDKR